MKRQGIAQKAIAAGLGLAMALGAVAPAAALAESTGNTNLYIESQTDNITTPEGAADENIKVVLPVAINYVADTEGNLTGPSDGTVKIRNNTQLGSVHVSKIKATPESGVTLAGSENDADGDDEVYLAMKPGTGTKVSLSAFQEEAAPASGDWDVAQQGELALNDLTGKIGGFSQIDPSTKTKVATVHWTVAPGTSAQAAANADLVTIHRVTPKNDTEDLTVSRRGSSTSLGSAYTWKLSDGTVVYYTSDVINHLSGGQTEITIYGTTNS